MKDGLGFLFRDERGFWTEGQSGFGQSFVFVADRAFGIEGSVLFSGLVGEFVGDRGCDRWANELHELHALQVGDDEILLVDKGEKVASHLQDADPRGDAVAREMAFVDAVCGVQLDGEKGVAFFNFLRFYGEKIVVKHLLCFCYKIKTNHDDNHANPAGKGNRLIEQKHSGKEGKDIADGS